MTNLHVPVLLKQVVEGLDLKEGDIYLDATLGAGGHMEAVYEALQDKVTLLGIDADSSAIDVAKARLELLGAKPKLAVSNFRNIDKALEILGSERPSKILFDLGWNAMQFSEGGRGFSFQKDEPLSMTLDSDPENAVFTAYDVVNSWEEENIADVIYGYGEEKFARRIAKTIIEARQKAPIKTSLQLAEIIKSAVPVFYRFGRIHPATKTFQAIRIAVNDELNALTEGLEKGFEILKREGRMAVISFHSLEDRIVKNFYKKLSDEGKAEVITKKPISAEESELQINPRARSAKLRIIKKIN